jgi:hypothetical protein
MGSARAYPNHGTILSTQKTRASKCPVDVLGSEDVPGLEANRTDLLGLLNQQLDRRGRRRTLGRACGPNARFIHRTLRPDTSFRVHRRFNGRAADSLLRPSADSRQKQTLDKLGEGARCRQSFYCSVANGSKGSPPRIKPPAATLSRVAGSGPRPSTKARSSTRRPCNIPGRPMFPSMQRGS